jgi:type IV pilus assembly protein PilX
MQVHLAYPRRGYVQNNSGAALVVGLILLLAISLMAIAGMNSAGLRLLPKSNDQFTIRAFQLADSAVELAFKNDESIVSSDGAVKEGSGGNDKDSFRYVVAPIPYDVPQPAIAGYSQAEFATRFYRLHAKGTSERGAAAEITQDIAHVIRASDVFLYSKGVCAASADLSTDAQICSTE